jgi:glycosyltransferase involved in cell wall biosynthesis
MRVAFELTGLELDIGGAARYAERMRHELAQADGVDLVELAQPGRRRGGTWGRIARGLSRELLYVPVRMPRAAREVGADLLHCATPVAPARSHVPVAVTIHDVMTWRHPEWFSRVNVLHQRHVLAPALRRAALVLTSSEYSRRELADLVGVDPGRIRVTPLAVDERFSPGQPGLELLERLGIRRPYVLSVGTLQPRKNIESAVRAFEALARRGIAHELVVVGARGWRDEALLEMVRRSDVAERITLAGRLSDTEMIDLYRGAECFVFPSLYEGFGIPPLEAMACGAPVVSSDRTSMPEVVGDAGLLVDPENVEALARALSEVLGSEERRAELRERGLTRASAFTWRRCVELTVEAYAETLGS